MTLDEHTASGKRLLGARLLSWHAPADRRLCRLRLRLDDSLASLSAPVSLCLSALREGDLWLISALTEVCPVRIYLSPNEQHIMKQTACQLALARVLCIITSHARCGVTLSALCSLKYRPPYCVGAAHTGTPEDVFSSPA